MAPLPPSKPKASLSLVMATALKRWQASKGDAAFPELFLLGVRGYFSESIGKPGNDISAYDDALFLVSPLGFSSWNANVDPSRYGANQNAEGKCMARLAPGCWKMVSLSHRGKYQAFGQGGHEVAVERIDSRGKVAQTETGCFGINIHLGGVNGTSSEGCQTLPPAQWEKFRSSLNEAMRVHSSSFIHYILAEGPIN